MGDLVEPPLSDQMATAALERLLLDDPEFRELESLVSPFNLFEAAGITRQELRHSDFLAFLMNPSASHGLVDRFLRRFLQLATRGRGSDTLAVTALELDLLDLSDARVDREWKNVDLLITSHQNRLAVLIENKVGTGEHDDQLERYLLTVRSHYPGWRILPILLSPSAMDPSQEVFVPVGYGPLADGLEALLDLHASAIGPEIGMSLRHYVAMVRRHVVEDSKVADLCKRIYARHKAALDLIFEFRPDRPAMVTEVVRTWLEQQEVFVLDQSSKNAVRFALSEWDETLLKQPQPQGWTNSGRMVLFEAVVTVRGVSITLYIGPGPDRVRRRLYEAFRSHQTFTMKYQELRRKWHRIYQKTLPVELTEGSVSQAELDEVIIPQLNAFLAVDVPAIKSAFQGERWLWEPPL